MKSLISNRTSAPAPAPVPVPARAFRAAALAASLGMAALSPAWADSDTLLPRVPLPAYQKECGSCHTAYPPALLPASSWGRVMGGLDRHYGSDASLDEATTRQIGAWLLAHAGTYKRVSESPPQDRITRSAWFERKHRKIDPRVWTDPAVKSAAQCAACHTRADQGDYNDDGVQLPAGLDPSLRRGKSLLWR